MAYLARKRTQRRPTTKVDVVCVLLVIAALVGLLVWMIVTWGGGALMI